MRPLKLSPSNYAALAGAGSSAWPKEACGLIFEEEGGALRVEPMANLQDQLHALDPATHPRDATQAYAMDPLKVDKMVESEAQLGNKLVGIFHSHPQHPAYFSDMDKRAAMPFGMPTYPKAWQLVMSVYDAKVVDIKAFQWLDADPLWIEGPLEGLPALAGPPPGARPLDDD